jgi:anti-anti-sigma factor
MSTRTNLDIEVSPRGKALLVRLIGELDLASVAEVRNALLKCVADEPAGVIVQLDRTTVATPLALSVFGVVSRKATDWPGVQVVLVARPGHTRELLRRGAVDRFMPTFALVAEAVQALHGTPVRQLATLELPPAHGSPARARRFVTETLGGWRIDALVEDACLIASELVENAVLHAHSVARLRLELRRGLLTIAVRDTSSERPARLEPGTAETGGRGIFIIDTLAKAWGTAPTWDGGKVVWATLAAAARA